MKCSKCIKTIRKNQGKATCDGCNQPYHFKCLGAEFEFSSKCDLCFTSPSVEEDLIETNLHCVADLSEAVNQRGLKFLHLNIRSIYK